MTAQDADDRWSHLDEQGRARMVDVGAKPVTERQAEARAVILLGAELRRRLLAGELPKGEALAVARVAGIQAAKETPRLIPLCHPLPLTGVQVTFDELGSDRVEVRARVTCRATTGVEMEAMCAASVAALALYDMCKGLDRGVRITDVSLLSKSGGRSGTWSRQPTAE